MAQKRRRPASPCQAATGLGFVKATRPDISEYSASHFLRQAEIDPVAWLAARANVATSTARLHAELFGFAGCQS